MAKKQKRAGLVLTLGGAAGPHTVGSFPGLYSPDEPTPVGGPGEMTLEEAQAADADEGCPLALVEMDEPEPETEPETETEEEE